MTLETVYFPLVRHRLTELQITSLYLTIDESSHTDHCGLFQVSLDTDGMVLPLGWLLYRPDNAWADEARQLLRTIATLVPASSQVTVLADRLHTGEPFLDCVTALGWDYIVRAKDDIMIETDKGWQTLRPDAAAQAGSVLLEHAGLESARLAHECEQLQTCPR